MHIPIKNLFTWPDFFFSWSLHSLWRFLPVLVATLTGDCSLLTGDKDNCHIVGLCCSLTEDMFSRTGDVGSFAGDVKFWCFLWKWWEMYLTFLLFTIVMKMVIFLIWWRFIWRDLRIITKGTKIWVVFVFINIDLSY